MGYLSANTVPDTLAPFLEINIAENIFLRIGHELPIDVLSLHLRGMYGLIHILSTLLYDGHSQPPNGR